MSEKYFIATCAVIFVLLTVALLGGIVCRYRLKYLKKLTRLNLLRRRQHCDGVSFFASAVADEAVRRLFFSLDRQAKAALSALVGGRPQKALLFFKNKDLPLSLLLEAHTPKMPSVYRKLERSRRLTSTPLTALSAALMAHLLFRPNELPRLLARLKKKHLPATLKAYEYYLSAIMYLQEGDMMSASAQASAALNLFKKAGYLFEEAQTYLLLAETYRISCVNDIAQVMTESALKIYKGASLDSLQAGALAALGRQYLFENRLEEAEDKLREALKTARQARLQGDILNQTALLKLAQKNERAALKTARRALTLHRQNNNERGEAFSRQLIGHFLLNKGTAESAVNAAKTAAALYLKQENFSAYAETLYLEARALCQLQNYTKAEKLLRLILAEDRQQSLSFHAAHAYSLLGLIYLQQHDLQRAKVLLQQSVRLEQNHERIPGLAADYANLALIETLSGNTDAAGDNFKLALEYAEKTEDEELAELIKSKMSF